MYSTLKQSEYLQPYRINKIVNIVVNCVYFKVKPTPLQKYMYKTIFYKCCTIYQFILTIII